jgi:hypothetical protein
MQQHEHVFRYACYTGQLSDAQWLYSLGNVNVHVNEG